MDADHPQNGVLIPRRFTLPLLRALIERLGDRATLKLLYDADHAFHVPARTGRTDPDVRREIVEALTGWLDEVIAG